MCNGKPVVKYHKTNKSNTNQYFIGCSLYSANNLVPTTKFDKIQITTTYSKKTINIKYKRTMIKQIKLNKILDFL